MILKWSKEKTLENLKVLQNYIDKNRYCDENIFL